MARFRYLGAGPGENDSWMEAEGSVQPAGAKRGGPPQMFFLTP